MVIIVKEFVLTEFDCIHYAFNCGEYHQTFLLLKLSSSLKTFFFEMTTFILHLTLATQSKDRIAAVLSHIYTLSYTLHQFSIYLSIISLSFPISLPFYLFLSLSIFISPSLSHSIPLSASFFLNFSL
jgi:hypothetical protein